MRMNKHHHQLMTSRFSHELNPVQSFVATLLRSIGATLLLACLGCHSSASVDETQKNLHSKTNDNMNAVITDVQTFAKDEGKSGEEAWARLSAHPRSELIDALRKIQSDTNNPSLSVDVAFVLCNLDHEYDLNRQMIVSAFTKAKRDAFSEERLIDRLIQRGDKDLLRVLFSAALYSDGALSEALSETFARELSKNTEQFLSHVSAEPSSTRKQIYRLLVGSLSPEDVTRVETAIRPFAGKPAVRKTAEELLHHLRMKEKNE
jgi:hypothetical protein